MTSGVDIIDDTTDDIEENIYEYLEGRKFTTDSGEEFTVKEYFIPKQSLYLVSSVRAFNMNLHDFINDLKENDVIHKDLELKYAEYMV